MNEFLAIRNALGPSGVPQARTNWINGGNINANAVLHNAPTSDMKMFKCGTNSAITTGGKEKLKIVNPVWGK